MGKKDRNIPGFFKYLEKMGSHSTPLYPLEFQVNDEEKEQFILAGKKIAVSNFKTRRMDINLEGVEKKRIEYRSMPEYPLLVSDRGLIVVGPRLLRYVTEQLAGSEETQKSLNELGLDCLALRVGGFCLKRTISDASISPAESSNFIEPPGEKGFAEYTFMADEDRGDRLVLLAGLGYLAGRAAQS